MLHRSIISALLLLFVASPQAGAFSFDPVDILSIESTASNNYEYINIRTNAFVSPASRYFENPDRLVLVFLNSKFAAPLSFLPSTESMVAKVLTSFTPSEAPSCEIVVFFKKKIKYGVANMMGRNLTAVEFTDDRAPVLTQEKPKAEEKPKQPKIEDEIHTMPIGVPDLSKTKDFKIILSGREFKLGKPVVFQGQMLLVPAKDFFEALDAQVIKRKDGSLLITKGDSQHIEFYPDSATAKVSGKAITLDAKTKTVLRYSGRDIYVSLSSLAGIVNYSFEWDSKAKTIAINPRLIAVSFTSRAPSYSVNLSLSGAVERERLSFSSFGRFVTVEVRDAAMANGLAQILDINEGDVARIFVKDAGARKLLVTLELKGHKPYRVSYSDSEDEYSLLFSTAISAIRATDEAGYLKLEAVSDGAISFEVSEIGSPERVVIDFQNAILTIPSPLKISDDFVLSTKASQFSLDPPSVRMVVTLSERAKTRLELSDDKRKLTLFINRPKVQAKKEIPKTYSVLNNKVIVIDPGHGGRDPGTIGYSGIYEKNVNLSLALKIAEVLERSGAQVLLSRERDSNPDLRKIVRFANSNRADMFISVHYNSFFSPYVSGVETYYYTPQSRLLARIIHKNMVKGVKQRDRGIKRVMYYTIHHTTMPSILVEPGYLTNKAEERLSLSPAFRSEVASDILRGVVEYFGVMEKYKK